MRTHWRSPPLPRPDDGPEFSDLDAVLRTIVLLMSEACSSQIPQAIRFSLQRLKLSLPYLCNTLSASRKASTNQTTTLIQINNGDHEVDETALHQQNRYMRNPLISVEDDKSIVLTRMWMIYFKFTRLHGILLKNQSSPIDFSLQPASPLPISLLSP
jgi:hypothetical protein